MIGLSKFLPIPALSVFHVLSISCVVCVTCSVVLDSKNLGCYREMLFKLVVSLKLFFSSPLNPSSFKYQRFCFFVFWEF